MAFDKSVAKVFLFPFSKAFHKIFHSNWNAKSGGPEEIRPWARNCGSNQCCVGWVEGLGVDVAGLAGVVGLGLGTSPVSGAGAGTPDFTL